MTMPPKNNINLGKFYYYQTMEFSKAMGFYAQISWRALNHLNITGSKFSKWHSSPTRLKTRTTVPCKTQCKKILISNQDIIGMNHGDYIQVFQYQ